MHLITKRRFVFLITAVAVVWAASAGISCKPRSGGSSENHVDHDQAATPQSLSGTVEDGVRVVQITASQFKFEPSRIVVAQGEQVRLEVTSKDVTHGITIGDMDIDRKLEPNKTETIDLAADKAGTFHFHCSVYCGAGHDLMHGELVVLPEHTGS